MTKFDHSQGADALPLSRRYFLLATTVLAGAAVLPRRLLAATELHRFQHGDFEVNVISDGHLTFPAGVLAPDAPSEEVQALLEAAGMGGEQVMPPTNPVLIRSGSDIILFDTGSGADFQPETAGKTAENLAAAGIDPESVTKVVFTHGHLDHLGGTAIEGGLRYPNASYYAAGTEWDFWMDPNLKSQMPEAMHLFVDGAQKHFSAVKEQVTMLKPGDEVVAGIRVLDTAGHTPGHVSFEVAGGDGLIIVGDAIAVPAVFFPHPEWRFGFDAIADLAVENRKALLDRAATDKIKMIGFHWPYPGVGYAERKDDAYRYVPEG